MRSDLDIYTQSAVLPYRITDGQLFILMITSRKGTRWIFPKGIVEPDLTPVESAAQEAYEEAGIEGPVSPGPIGQYTHDKWGGTCTITVFPMRVEREHEEWPEGAMRERRWVPLEEAIDLIDSPALKDIVARFAETVEENE